MNEQSEMQIEEAIAKANSYQGDAGKGVPSVSRTLLAELSKKDARIKELVIQADRYEKVRRLNVPQFQELFVKNVKGLGRFDDLVDQIPVSLAQPPETSEPASQSPQEPEG